MFVDLPANMDTPDQNNARRTGSSRRRHHLGRNFRAGPRNSPNTVPVSENRGFINAAAFQQEQSPERHVPQSPVLVAETPAVFVDNDVVHVSHQSAKRSRSDDEVQAYQPPQKKTRIVEETNMWTTVKKYLQNAEDTPEPQVSCPICMVDIAIRGIPSQYPSPYKLINGDQAVGTVLPCAHIICQACIAKHIQTSSHKTCPCCRADLRYSGCGHLTPSKRIPVATGENESMIPPTMPELVAAGSKFPEHCFTCQESGTRKYAEIGFNFIADLIYDTSTGSAGVSDPAWHNVIDASIQVVLDHVVNISGRPDWKSTGMSDNVPLQVAFINDSRLGAAAKKSEHDGQDVIEYVQEEGIRTALWSVPLWRGQ